MEGTMLDVPVDDGKIPVKMPNSIAHALASGDFSSVPDADKDWYYQEKCKSLGLNPLTQPFRWLALNGKLQLYALKDCSEQLRKLYGVSLWVDEPKFDRELVMVHVRGRDRQGREDEDYGFAKIGNAKGDELGNAILKAITKGKRRTTLSICGLGILDETEVETIPNAVTYQREVKPASLKEHPTKEEMDTLQEYAKSVDIDEAEFWLQIRRMLDIPVEEKVSKKGIRDRMTMSQYEAADTEYRAQLKRSIEETDVSDEEMPEFDAPAEVAPDPAPLSLDAVGDETRGGEIASAT